MIRLATLPSTPPTPPKTSVRDADLLEKKSDTLHGFDRISRGTTLQIIKEKAELDSIEIPDPWRDGYIYLRFSPEDYYLMVKDVRSVERNRERSAKTQRERNGVDPSHPVMRLTKTPEFYPVDMDQLLEKIHMA